MNTSRSFLIGLAAAVLIAAPPMTASAQATIDVQMTNTIFVNGGIGEDEADAMRSRLPFLSRVVFAEGPQNAFTANVPLAIVDEQGNAVFALPDAGPLLFVILPAGTYTVSAESDGVEDTASHA